MPAIRFNFRPSIVWRRSRCWGFMLFLLISGVAAGQHPMKQNDSDTKRLRSEQKQQRSTMTTIKAIAAAWETYYQDFSTYCPLNAEHPDFQWGNMDPAALEALLVPKYIEKLPLTDGWDRPLQFAVQCTPPGALAYGIRSTGADGQWDPNVVSKRVRPLRSGGDIVYRNGVFERQPVGATP